MSTEETVVVGRVQDIGNPGAREFAVFAGDRSLRGFLVRRGEHVYAYVNRCPHAGSALNRSPDGFLGLNNQSIMCRSHGALFEIETGQCVEGPCIGESLQKLPIQVRDGTVLLKFDCSLEHAV